MITTDATYDTLIASGAYEESITGTLKDGSGTTVLNITNEYIKTGSLTIDNKCINNDDLEPGAVYAAELKITITGNAGLTSSQKSSLQNGSLNLTYTITDGDSSSSIGIGIYYIIEVTLKDEDVEIVAEDMMSRLSKNIPAAVRESLAITVNTPYELLLAAAENCSTTQRPITLVNDETEFESWCNADATFEIPTTADIATYRDLVAEVAKIMGCFATIDKSTNGLVLKRLNPHSNSNVWTLNEDIRYRTEKSGYICKFGKVALGNVSYPTTSDDNVSGLVLSMRATELTDDASGLIENLYNEMTDISYRPCKIDFMGNIALEVGDWIGVNYTEDDTTYTFRTIITHLTWTLNGKELIEATGSSAATTKKVGSKGSNESRNSSSIDNLTNRIETLESSGSGGNKIYTSKSAPDTTLGNEGDLWVKYHTENNDKFINSDNEEIDVNIPRYESDNDALSYVDTTIRPILRTIKDTSASQLSAIVKQFEKECTVVLYQSSPIGVITTSQFPQLVIDTYMVNNQSVPVIQGDTILSSGGTTVTSRAIGSNKSACVNVDDFDGTLVEDGGNWHVIYRYLYYNTTTRYLNIINGYLDINWYSHTLPYDTLNTIVTNYSIDLADTSVMIIDELYCKIGDDWVGYDGDGGSVVAVKQILQSGTEIAQISVNGEVVSIYAPGGNKVYTSTRIPTSSDTANEGDLWYQMNYTTSSAFDFPNWGYTLPLVYDPGNFRLEDVRSSLELRFYDTVNDIYLYYLFLGGTNYVIGYNRLGPTNTFDGFDKDTGELQVTTENEQGTAWSYWNYIPRWNDVSPSYLIANPLATGYSDNNMSPTVGTTTYNLYSILGYASKISSGRYRLDGFRLITNAVETSWQYGVDNDYNVIARWVYKENNWQVADYIAGDGVTIKNGIISANGSAIVQVNPIVTSGTQLATINGTSIYAPTTTVTQTLTQGTEIAQINGTSLYAPTGGGSDVTVTPITTTGTNIANIAVNGTTYRLFAPSSGGGGGGEVKRSIDWDNKVDITLPYTATADGYFYFRMWQMKCQLTINGVDVISEAEFDNEVSGTKIYPISTGDVLELAWGTTPSTMWFVPLKETGSSPSSGHNYSTNEQVIGTWIDGSTVYECTYDLGSDLTLQDSTWVDTGISVPTNANRCIKAEGIQSDGTSTCIMASVASTNIAVQSTKNGGDTVRYITIQYTKTS